MSSMIRCDKCKKMMYADSRSDKGDWCTVRIDYVDGLPEEYDEEFGSWWDDEVTE